MSTFAELGVPADIVTALAKHGITEPFPVQAATIADALAGRDVCGKAPTGSGKTLAFGIPLVVRVEAAKPRRPRALVLAPTRELAAQIQKELAPMAQARNKRVFTIYGGVGYEPQRKALRNGVEILVACPGRLRDLINQDAVRLDNVEIVVIDEADRMADMGFLPEVRKILDETSAKRQTVLFSATLDGDVALLTRNYQTDPVTHEVEGVDEEGDVAHHFEDCELDERPERTAKAIREHGPTIVFTRTRHGAEKVAKQLKLHGIDSAPIHGGLSQAKRDRALAGFKAYKVEALIATDVAARGIHVNEVACVIHFDPPVDTKTYIHRSGRTGRAGKTGVVLSLLDRAQRKEGLKLQRELGLLSPQDSGRVGTGAYSGGKQGGKKSGGGGGGGGRGGSQGRSGGSGGGDPRGRSESESRGPRSASRDGQRGESRGGARSDSRNESRNDSRNDSRGEFRGDSRSDSRASSQSDGRWAGNGSSSTPRPSGGGGGPRGRSGAGRRAAEARIAEAKNSGGSSRGAGARRGGASGGKPANSSGSSASAPKRFGFGRSGNAGSGNQGSAR